jgi:hypothetical protein
MSAAIFYLFAFLVVCPAFATLIMEMPTSHRPIRYEKGDSTLQPSSMNWLAGLALFGALLIVVCMS